LDLVFIGYLDVLSSEPLGKRKSTQCIAVGFGWLRNLGIPGARLWFFLGTGSFSGETGIAKFVQLANRLNVSVFVIRPLHRLEYGSNGHSHAKVKIYRKTNRVKFPFLKARSKDKFPK
jgi:hypothetical protein